MLWLLKPLQGFLVVSPTVILPFWLLPSLEFFIPSRFLIYAYAVAAGWNYHTWIVDTWPRALFFLTFMILVWYTSVKRAEEFPVLAMVIIFSLLISQILIVVYGDMVTRESSFKEYKEFFIPLSFFIYSLEIRLRAKKMVSSTFRPPTLRI